MAGSKLYKVTDIDFWNLTIEARETDLDVCDIPESEVFCLEDFGNFRIKLVNEGGKGEIIDFEEWRKIQKFCQ